jgi:6-phosphofructokinase 1
VLALRFGVRAMDVLAEGKSGVMVALHGDKIVDVPLAEATKQRKTVDQDWLALADVFCEGPTLAASR